MDAVEVREKIRTQARAIGFDAVGFARAVTSPADQANLRRYIAEGRHGEMAWMADTEDRRADPLTLWPDAKTVIALGMNYGPEEDPLAIHGEPDRAAISVYARNKDYHDLVKKRLKTLARWMVETFGGDLKVFVDTAPVMEGPLAMAAGLGWVGKHTNLVSPEFGSWLFLGEIFTTLDLPADPPGADRCGSCTACLDACPTAAFTAPYEIDARRCVSYLTIELKAEIPDEFRTAMGNRIYGCDDCLAVCPWNKFALTTAVPQFRAKPESVRPELAALIKLDDTAFRVRFAGSPIKRIGWDRFMRNIIIAIGNSGTIGFSKAILSLLKDPNILIATTAAWAAKKLGSRP